MSDIPKNIAKLAGTGGHSYPCPLCQGQTGVNDTRPAAVDGVRRRRICRECGHRFTTYETQWEDAHKFVELLEALQRRNSIAVATSVGVGEEIARVLGLASASREIENSRYGIAGPNFPKQQETT